MGPHAKHLVTGHCILQPGGILLAAHERAGLFLAVSLGPGSDAGSLPTYVWLMSLGLISQECVSKQDWMAQQLGGSRRTTMQSTRSVRLVQHGRAINTS